MWVVDDWVHTVCMCDVFDVVTVSCNRTNSTHTDEWIYLQSQKINELKEGLKDLAATVGVTVTQLIKS